MGSNEEKSKEEALMDWVLKNPYFEGKPLLNYLKREAGATALVPIPAPASASAFVGGSKAVQYDFMLQIMLNISDTGDNVNAESLRVQRMWQEWIEDMEYLGDYPDFGHSCLCYELANLNNMPALALTYDDGLAKYQFGARLMYLEEK